MSEGDNNAATIVETNTKKFKRKDIDPITLDIIENAMMNARYEMMRSSNGYVTGIREQNDMFPMIAYLEGKMVVGQFGSFIHGFKEAYDGTIEEGDLFLTTDPYACNGAISHINDWLLLRPIFKDGRLIAYAAMFGHMTTSAVKCPAVCPPVRGRFLRRAFACRRSRSSKTMSQSGTEFDSAQ